MEQIKYPNYNGNPFEKCCIYGKKLGNDYCIKFGYSNDFPKESRYCKSCFKMKQHLYYEANRETLAKRAKNKYVKKIKLVERTEN
jgi:hypothetical protein